MLGRNWAGLKMNMFCPVSLLSAAPVMRRERDHLLWNRASPDSPQNGSGGVAGLRLSDLELVVSGRLGVTGTAEME